MIRLQEDTPREMYENLDEDALANIFQFLSQQTQGLKHLSDILKQDVHDMQVMLQQLKQTEP